jgi:hypothetical protein
MVLTEDGLIYWPVIGANQVFLLPANGDKPVSLALTSAVLYGLAADEKAIYWADNAGIWQLVVR